MNDFVYISLGSWVHHFDVSTIIILSYRRKSLFFCGEFVKITNNLKMKKITMSNFNFQWRRATGTRAVTSYLPILVLLIFSMYTCCLDRSCVAFLTQEASRITRSTGGASSAWSSTTRSTTRIKMATIDRKSPRKRNNAVNRMDTSVDKDTVLFQKVIRPTKDLPDVLFLGYLVEYIANHFELPSDLPMIYETTSTEEGIIDNNDRIILSLDSPLSPCSELTRLKVEVVGIYTEDNQKTEAESSSETSDSRKSTPRLTMAMVVVRKRNEKSQKNTLPAMLKGLFRDSENRIVKALDRGLDDLVSGRIKVDATTDDQTRPRNVSTNVRTVEEAMEAELVDDYPQMDAQQVSPKDVVYDTYATTDDTNNNSNDSCDTTLKTDSTSDEHEITKQQLVTTPQQRADAKDRAMATMKFPTGVNTARPFSKPSDADFAVEAAKQKILDKSAAEGAKVHNNSAEVPNKKSRTNADEDDFAVMAARRAAENRKKKKIISTNEPKEDVIPFKKSNIKDANRTKLRTSKVRGTNGISKKEPQPNESGQKIVQKQPSMPPIPDGWKPRDYFEDQRSFKTTISRPSKKQSKKKIITNANTPKEKLKPISSSSPDKAKENQLRAQNPLSKESIKKEQNTTANVVNKGTNIKFDPMLKEAGRKTSNKTNDEIVSTFSNTILSKESIENEAMKATKDAMDEIANQGVDMTPEELLKDILKFDDEKKKEEEPGSGFVSGAFEKAKELMNDRHKKQVGFKEVDRNEHDQPSINNPHTMTAEEELRAMFAAGQKIADGKITENIKSNGIGTLKKTGTTDEDVNQLIDEEKTVSKYARVLEDELVELEVRINRSPAEDLDGPPKNPMFDVMSGPEAYNPNVEPDAVNYPGAMAGTADVKLPKELKEAINQATFAVEVLKTVKLVETKDGSAKYFSGDKELSTKQVESLKTLVAEATKSGIIEDPINLLAERSRLQLVVDELGNQPDERFLEVASNYKDLLLSDNFVGLVRERLANMADRDLDALRRDDESLREPHEQERNILGQLVVYAQGLLKEARALGAELEAHQLEIVRSICKVAMDPSHTTEEETAMALSDAVADMRPLLDDAFVAYLKYAVAEEESRLARANLLDDPDYNQWLFVLKIVQQGVYAEISKGINRYIDHIWYVLRMKTPRQRRLMLQQLIDDMPTLDIRPFLQVVDNIVGSLGDGVNGNFDELVPLGEMTNKLLQLQRDVHELLPPERIAEKSRDADEWAATQKKRLLEQRKIGEQRLQGVKEANQRSDEVEQMFGTGGGEIDRFD